MAYAIAHVDEIPELESRGEPPLRPVRHHFGITAFGATAWTATSAGDRLINEHEEDEGNEELYVVLRGRAVFELDGERRDAPAGTLVFAPSKVKRTAFAEEPGTTVLAVGGVVGRPYEAAGWELWYPLRTRYEAGEYAEVVARGRELLAEHPQNALLLYNVACCESLSGDTEAALAHLHSAVELSGRFREYAKRDPDLDALRGDPAFAELVGS